jgi:hypothetical protein
MHPNKGQLIMSRESLVALVLLAAFVSVGETQPRPATLTSSVSSGGPGTTFRIDVDPVIGLDAERAAETRMVLRPSQARGPQTDLVLSTLEYYGAWFLVQIPRDAGLDRGPCRLLWLNRRGDVLASSGDRLFRVVSAASRAARPERDIIRPRERMTAPGARAEAQEAQVMTAPGIAVQAKRLPTPVVDYVTIGLNELDIKVGVRYPLAFMLPADTRLDDRVVLTLMVNAAVGGVQNRLYISVNGQEVESVEFGHAGTRAWNVVFNARILRPGRNEFEISGGGMRLTVKDIVLWFHRDIAG